MSTYIKLNDLSYPWHEGDIRIDHPEIPDHLTGDDFPVVSDYAKLEVAPIPDFDHENERCYQMQPVNQNGTWFMAWGVRAATQKEKDELQQAILSQQERITGIPQS